MEENEFWHEKDRDEIYEFREQLSNYLSWEDANKRQCNNCNESFTESEMFNVLGFWYCNNCHNKLVINE